MKYFIFTLICLISCKQATRDNPVDIANNQAIDGITQDDALKAVLLREKYSTYNSDYIYFSTNLYGKTNYDIVINSFTIDINEGRFAYPLEERARTVSTIPDTYIWNVANVYLDYVTDYDTDIRFRLFDNRENQSFQNIILYDSLKSSSLDLKQYFSDHCCLWQTDRIELQISSDFFIGKYQYVQFIWNNFQSSNLIPLLIDYPKRVRRYDYQTEFEYVYYRFGGNLQHLPNTYDFFYVDGDNYYLLNSYYNSTYQVNRFNPTSGESQEKIEIPAPYNGFILNSIDKTKIYRAIPTAIYGLDIINYENDPNFHKIVQFDSPKDPTEILLLNNSYLEAASKFRLYDFNNNPLDSINMPAETVENSLLDSNFQLVTANGNHYDLSNNQISFIGNVNYVVYSVLSSNSVKSLWHNANYVLQMNLTQFIFRNKFTGVVTWIESNDYFSILDIVENKYLVLIKALGENKNLVEIHDLFTFSLIHSEEIEFHSSTGRLILIHFNNDTQTFRLIFNSNRYIDFKLN
ncbi:MAG: hypothetical protein KDD94_05320 [Calditrichaeota bacterium]|nr:hypothetical protein [Calditrichota bacterium]